METAVIRVMPEKDEAIVALLSEVNSILEYAHQRTIASADDVKTTTNDLSLISKLKRVVEDKRKEYLLPLQEHTKAINDAFKLLSEPLAEADKITRQKVLAYNAEIERQRQEAEAIDRAKYELAQREAALKGGEITIDLTPTEAPPATPVRIRTDIGMVSKMKVRKWEIINFSLVPDDLKVIDAGKVTKLVKAGIGGIAGIRIWEEETLRVATNKED